MFYLLTEAEVISCAPAILCVSEGEPADEQCLSLGLFMKKSVGDKQNFMCDRVFDIYDRQVNCVASTNQH